MRKVIVLSKDEIEKTPLFTKMVGGQFTVMREDEEFVPDLDKMRPFDLVLFIGASCPKYLRKTKGARVIEIPSLSNVRWNERRLAFVSRIIREGTEDVEIRLDKRTGQVIAESLVPF